MEWKTISRGCCGSSPGCRWPGLLRGLLPQNLQRSSPGNLYVFQAGQCWHREPSAPRINQDGEKRIPFSKGFRKTGALVPGMQSWLLPIATAHRTATSRQRACTGRKNPLSMLWFVPTTQIIQIPRGAIHFGVAPFLLRTQPQPTCLASQMYQSHQKIPLSREEKKQTSQNSCPTPESPRQPVFLRRH